MWWCPGRPAGGAPLPAPALPGWWRLRWPEGEGRSKRDPLANSQTVFDLDTAAGSWQKQGKAGRCDCSAELQRSNIPGQAHLLQRLCVGTKSGRKEGRTHSQRAPGGSSNISGGVLPPGLWGKRDAHSCYCLHTQGHSFGVLNIAWQPSGLSDQG